MDRYHDLDAVLARVWDELEAAARDPGHPFRTLTFGTASPDGGPHLRTVVLRVADRERRVLSFHTDRHAQKVEDIRTDARVAWHGWRPDTKEQVRLRGSASVHLDDDVANAMWADQDPKSLAVHARHTASGTSVEAPDDGLVDAVHSEPVTREEVAAGREHFAVVRTVVDEVDWLHLHPDGHYRAQFEKTTPEEAPQKRWVIP